MSYVTFRVVGDPADYTTPSLNIYQGENFNGVVKTYYEDTPVIGDWEDFGRFVF